MSPTSVSCYLCGLPLRHGSVQSVSHSRTFSFCCMGCRQVFTMLAESDPDQDPAQFKDSELFKKCQAMGIIPRSEAELDQRAVADPADGDSLSGNAAAQSAPSRHLNFEQGVLSLHLIIDNMWCPACAWVIEAVLGKHPGVLNASCNFSTDRVRCEYNPIQTSPQQIMRAIGDLGYQAAAPGEVVQTAEKKTQLVRFAVSVFFTVNVMMLSFALYSGFFTSLTPDAVYKLSWPLFVMTSIVIFYGGPTIYRKAWSGFLSAAYGMEALITIGAFSAYLYSTFNLLSGSIHLYYDTAAMLITLTLLGKTIERKAKDTVQEDLVNFFSIRPTKVKRCSREFPRGRYVAAEGLGAGDDFIIEQGEIVCADGLILEGSGLIDESSLTGEARPVRKTAGNRVKSGIRVLQGLFKVRAEGVGETSTLGQMIKIMEKALGQKTPLEGKTDRILQWFVPSVLILSVATGMVGLICGFSFEKALIRSVTVMVISCPCAVGIAIPIARVAGISLAGIRGILVRDFSAFEKAEKTDTFVFDKTGTLTKGNWELLEIRAIEPFTRKQVLRLAAALEKESDHYIAAEIKRHAGHTVLQPAPIKHIRCHQNGVSGMLDQDEIRIGSKDFMGDALKTSAMVSEAGQQDEALQSTVYMSCGGRMCAVLIFGDILKDGAVKTVEKLREMGYSTALVSGDGDITTRTVGDLLGIPNALGARLPQDKAFFVRDLQKKGNSVAMVGDGINDAPALVQSDLAFAVHSGGHLGKEAADVTLMQGDPGQILDYMTLARLVNSKIHQNLIWSLAYNTVSIPIAMSGLLTPLVAVCAMLLSSLSVIGNTLLLKHNFKRAHAKY